MLPDTRLRSDALWFAVCCLFMAGLWIVTPGDAVPARAASPSDLSPYGASCQHCIPIAESHG
jgi:hypothetical protein